MLWFLSFAFFSISASNFIVLWALVPLSQSYFFKAMTSLRFKPDPELSIFPQSLLFLNDNTLRGFKRNVYVLIKILKFCTGSSAKSYQCKFAIATVLRNYGDEATEGQGNNIQKIINLNKLHGNFSSVHHDLKQEGIIVVEVGESFIKFLVWLLSLVLLDDLKLGGGGRGQGWRGASETSNCFVPGR